MSNEPLANGLKAPVIAYFASWSGTAEGLPYQELTHLNYSFVLPTPDGGLTAPEDALLEELSRRCHEHGVKIGLAIGGWNDGDCSAFEKMAARKETRTRFIDRVVDMLEAYDLDGADIDWEYPKLHSASDFSLLMAELAAALKPRGKLLSAAVIAEGDEFGQFVRPEVFQHLDYLNIMAYDWFYQKEGNHHSSEETAASSLDYWIKKGCPKEKAILGVPFYGRSHKEAKTYKELIALDPEAPGKDAVNGILYNGLASMRRKAALALQKGGGIMFWELTQDTQDASSLLKAITSTVRGA
jgi:GH18 family chitinase